MILLVVPFRSVLADDGPASLDFQPRPLASDRAESLCAHMPARHCWW
jgi:hypothetical protein